MVILARAIGARATWLMTLTLVVVLLGCSPDETADVAVDPADDESPDAEPVNGEEDVGEDDVGDDGVGEDGADVDLAAVCDDRIVVQMGWFPQPARGHLFAVAEPGGEVTDDGKYIAPFKVDSSVEIEIRAGGPYIGFQPRETVAYADTDIMLFEVTTDEQVQGAERFPSTTVVAPYVKNPQILMWNPEAHDFDSIEDIRASQATVFVFEGIPFWQYLVHVGLLDREQIDTGYTGAPDRFVAEGDIVQQEFVTDGPYIYEEELGDWGRPVDWLLIADHSDFDPYVLQLAVRAAELDEHRSCLERLVPVFQQGVIDYVTSPDETNRVISEMLEELGEFYQVSLDRAAWAVDMIRDQELVGNGPDGAVGSFDMDRVQAQIDQLIPVFEEQGIDVPDGLSAEDLVTNEFIDPTIGF